MGECSTNYPKTRKSLYTIDHTFFDFIDTEEKAYWLGFITADGNIFTGSGKNRISVQLAACDDGHLRKLVKSLGSNRPISYTKRNEATVVFNSKPMVESLEAVGVGPRKSASVRPWHGSSDLMRHYWRGMVDGDGTISPCQVRNKFTVGLCGSPYCVTEFANWARYITGSKAMPRQTTNSICWSWQVSGTWSPQRLITELYSDSTVYLDRKKAIADKFTSIEYKNSPKRT